MKIFSSAYISDNDKNLIKTKYFNLTHNKTLLIE